MSSTYVVIDDGTILCNTPDHDEALLIYDRRRSAYKPEFRDSVTFHVLTQLTLGPGFAS